MKYCPNDCMIIPNKDNFCYKCGAKLISCKECSCGRELSELDNFCPDCSKEVKK